MSIEQFLLWVAVAAFVCGAVTGVVAHMKWMDYSKCKNRRSVSIALSVCAAAYGVALAAMETRLLLRGDIQEAVTSVIVVAVGAVCLTALSRRSRRVERRRPMRPAASGGGSHTPPVRKRDQDERNDRQAAYSGRQ